MDTEILKKLKKIYDQADSFGKEVIEKEFPELKDYEGERIRRFLIEAFTEQYLCSDKSGEWHGEPVTNILTWLEKQGKKEETPCDRCRKEQPSHSCQDITSLGRCYMEGEQKEHLELKA